MSQSLGFIKFISKIFWAVMCCPGRNSSMQQPGSYAGSSRDRSGALTQAGVRYLVKQLPSRNPCLCTESSTHKLEETPNCSLVHWIGLGLICSRHLLWRPLWETGVRLHVPKKSQSIICILYLLDLMKWIGRFSCFIFLGDTIHFIYFPPKFWVEFTCENTMVNYIF